MPGKQLKALYKTLRKIDQTRSSVELLHASKNLSKLEVEIVYEALFVRAVTAFEQFLEQIFFAILYDQTTHKPPKVSRLLKTSSKESMNKIVRRDDNYLDWLPYKRTEDRAQLYLFEGKPFSAIDNGDKSSLADILRIRNAIAHKSEHANKQFLSKVIGNSPLLKDEKRPAGFLRSKNNASLSIVRFEAYVGRIAQIARKIDIY